MFAGFPDFAQNPPSTPWRAKASVNVIIEERSFTSRGVQLSGTLYIPRANKPVPAIVVLHSASSPTRDMPLYQHLIEMLPPLGIGVSFTIDAEAGSRAAISPRVITRFWRTMPSPLNKCSRKIRELTGAEQVFGA
jgi:hypothetical protein